MKRQSNATSWISAQLSCAIAMSAIAVGGCQSATPAADKGASADAGKDGGDKAGAAGDKDKEKAGTGTKDGGSVSTTPSSAGSGTLPVGMDKPLPHEGGDVLAHFAMPNPSKFITDVKPFIKDPQASAMFDENTMRSLAKMGLGERAGLADNLDLSKPFGCAVFNPKKHADSPAPVACVMGYKGGAAVLATDLGAEGKRPDAAGHTAIFDVEGQAIYIDALDDGTAMVASVGDVAAAAKTYLKTDIVDRASAMHGDVEVVLYINDAYNAYQSEVDGVLATLDAANGAGAPLAALAPTPELGQALKGWMEYGAKNNKRNIEAIRDLEQMTLNFGFESYGVFFGASVIPKPGSRLETMAKSQGARAVDGAFIKRMPDSSFAVLSAVASWDMTKDLPETKEATQMMADTWAAMTGGDAAAAKAGLEQSQAEAQELYSGESVMALGDTPASLFAVATAVKLKSGQSGTAKYREWTAVFTPELILGDKVSKYLTWSFTNDVANVDGVAVDRWVIKPGPELEKTMKSEMSKDDAATIARVWGPIELAIDRAEVGDAVLFTVAPKDQDAFMKSAIAAQKGTGSLQSDASLDDILARDAQAGLLMGFNVKKGIDWLKSLEGVGEELGSVPANLGAGLNDVHMVGEYGADGTMSGMMVLSNPFLHQIVDAAMGG